MSQSHTLTLLHVTLLIFDTLAGTQSHLAVMASTRSVTSKRTISYILVSFLAGRAAGAPSIHRDDAVIPLSFLFNRQTPSQSPSFTRLGCFTDAVDGAPRTLPGPSTASATQNSAAFCASFCGEEYPFFGTEFGRECWCGGSQFWGATQVADSECNFPCPGSSNGETCGAGNRIEIYENPYFNPRKPADTDTLCEYASYVGCFEDPAGGAARALAGASFAADDMTAALCMEKCEGFHFFGTEFSRECFCGNRLPYQRTFEAECAMPCAGNNRELCGAGNRLSVYEIEDFDVLGGPDPVSSAAPVPTSATSTTSVASTTATVTTDPSSTHPANVDTYSYVGCFSDGAPRVLSAKSISETNMTPALCATFCAGHAYFGLEFSSECWCGYILPPDTPQAAESTCDMPCSGDSSSICGGSLRLSIYHDASLDPTPPSPPPSPASVPGYTYQSCWVDSVGDRALKGAVHVDGNLMTAALCGELCGGSKFFGTQFAHECFCGEELLTGVIAASEEECGMPCAGDAAERCGGPQRLSLYVRNGDGGGVEA